MITSEKTDELAKALVAFQKALIQPRKTETNPFYRSAYSDLATVWAACSEPLAANGLAFAQTITTDDEAGTITWKEPIKEDKKIIGERDVLGIWLVVTSRLMHASEQYLQSHIRMPVEADPQSLGKVTTYIRRYSMMAMLGIAPEDDDGYAASQQRPAVPHTTTPAAERKPCPLHPGQFLTKQTNDKGASWWSHKLPDGSYCNEKRAAPKETIPKPPVPAAPSPAHHEGNVRGAEEIFSEEKVEMDEAAFCILVKSLGYKTKDSVQAALGVDHWMKIREMGWQKAASQLADLQAAAQEAAQ